MYFSQLIVGWGIRSGQPRRPYTLQLDTLSRRLMQQALMIPNRKRAKDLDDMLMGLGFHARRSNGPHGPHDAHSAHNTRGPTTNKAAKEACPGSDHAILEERGDSMIRRVQASRKRRLQTTGTLCAGR